jgi:hypothetical protein
LSGFDEPFAAANESAPEKQTDASKFVPVENQNMLFEIHFFF